jgi:hypothetical protein
MIFAREITALHVVRKQQFNSWKIIMQLSIILNRSNFSNNNNYSETDVKTEVTQILDNINVTQIKTSLSLSDSLSLSPPSFSKGTLKQ